MLALLKHEPIFLFLESSSSVLEVGVIFTGVRRPHCHSHIPIEYVELRFYLSPCVSIFQAFFFLQISESGGVKMTLAHS